MTRIKKLLIAGAAVLAVSSVSITAFAAGTYGASAVDRNKTYSLTEMLTYAIQDEELAYAEYAKITDTFGSARPFANILKAEQSHIAALEGLFTANGIALPENTAAGYVTAASSLTDALNAGVQAEQDNIAMYETFLSQPLPDSVKTVFTALKSASEQHLAAFERSLSGGTGNPAGKGYGAGGGMYGQGACNGTGTGAGTMNRGQDRSGACNGACFYQG